ncbi:hypothetical protein O3P69_006665 [Scylla paramamosain]|uniref:Ig-like domain-containing protein n=1 Tax=Scylla paramamosain TaxID=85552 RepID=A0AAW0U0D4_SCYPA
MVAVADTMLGPVQANQDSPEQKRLLNHPRSLARAAGHGVARARGSPAAGRKAPPSPPPGAAASPALTTVAGGAAGLICTSAGRPPPSALKNYVWLREGDGSPQNGDGPPSLSLD